MHCNVAVYQCYIVTILGPATLGLALLSSETWLGSNSPYQEGPGDSDGDGGGDGDGDGDGDGSYQEGPD